MKARLVLVLVAVLLVALAACTVKQGYWRPLEDCPAWAGLSQGSVCSIRTDYDRGADNTSGVTSLLDTTMAVKIYSNGQTQISITGGRFYTVTGEEIPGEEYNLPPDGEIVVRRVNRQCDFTYDCQACDITLEYARWDSDPSK